MSTIRPQARSIAGSLRWLALAMLVLGAGACQQAADRLLLLDVRPSGELPARVSALRFSAMGWPTRSVAGVLGPGGLLVGYYGPSGSGPVTVTVEAIDAMSCVLGTGSVTVPDTSSGQTAPKVVVYVSALPETTCMLRDAGFGSDAGDGEAGADGPDADGASSDGEAGTDVRADTSADLATDRPRDTGSTADAGVDAITGGDARPVTDGGDASDTSSG